MEIAGARTITIAARADDVWRLVADVTRMPEWSPHVRSCRWEPPATGPALGARFTTTVALPVVRRWTNTSTVVRCEPGRFFGFAVGSDADDPNTVWEYEFEADGERTVVTERWEMRREPGIVLAYYRLIGQERRLARGVEQTLERLRVAAERQ
ncbi:MAG: SRPBCC family protein [Ilumatobacteraceae bacterium]